METARRDLPPALLVLAGGRGRRLGGVSKADVVLGGRRLLERVLEARADCGTAIVVALEEVEVPDGVLRTLEDPPDGGPVAGIAAGLRVLAAEDAPEQAVLVLGCDMPAAAALTAPLRAAFARTDAHGVVAAGPDGRAQMLALLVERRALAKVLETGSRDRSMRSVHAALALEQVAVPAAAVEDLDTWQQHETWSRRLEQESR